MEKKRHLSLTFNSPVILTFVIPLTVILVAVIFIGQQVYEGLFIQDNISNMGHILGGIVGAAVGYTLNKKM
ncbi:MAG: rhomboid family intramembrane serine protease [Mogibacterium sp.]|nr:rhomboid family intramembrane serine protease [Mogibacterium sp.]